MTTLVVQYHPLDDSYSAALRARVVEVLEGRRAPFECYRLAAGEQPDADDLADATALILVFPTWSGGLPARLLAWVHEVLDLPTGALAGVRTITAVTTCGSSRFVNTVQGEWGRRYLRRTLLTRCHPRARFRWLALYKVDRATSAETTAHLDRLDQLLA